MTAAKAEHFRKLEALYAGAPINRYFNPTIQISEGVAEVVIAIQPDFLHAAHAVHGSVYFKALDDAAFFAVNSIVEDVFVLTASFTIQFLRPVASGRLLARGRVVNASRRVYVADSELFNSEDQLIGRGTGSFMRSEIRLDPGVGYVLSTEIG
jgi:uncharacterized protein (TIGR00369 family)